MGVLAFGISETVAASGNTGDIQVGAYKELAIDIVLSALTGTSIAFSVSRKDDFGNYLLLFSETAHTTAPSFIPVSLGVGAETSRCFGNIIRVSWTCTAVSSASFTISMIGK